MGMRITARPGLGPLRFNAGTHGLASVTLKLGPLSWRLWSRTQHAGLSSLDLPGPLSWRPQARRRDQPRPPAALGVPWPVRAGAFALRGLWWLTLLVALAGAAAYALGRGWALAAGGAAGYLLVAGAYLATRRRAGWPHQNPPGAAGGRLLLALVKLAAVLAVPAAAAALVLLYLRSR